MEKEWLIFESGKSSADDLHRVGTGELQGESKEAQTVREIMCRLWPVPNNTREDMEKGNVRLF